MEEKENAVFFRLANIFKGIVEFNGVWFVTLATQVCREKIDYLSPLFYWVRKCVFASII